MTIDSASNSASAAKILPTSFYAIDDAVTAAKACLGKGLFSQIDGAITGAVITEVEAYSHQGDQACHAHLNKKTKRTQVMFAQGGCLYAYLCYGIHTLINIVTNDAGKADAVLIRAIVPLIGKDLMSQRRGRPATQPNLIGPGKVSQALGITAADTGISLQGERVWLSDLGLQDLSQPKNAQQIEALKRVGIDYAGEDANLLWRFRLTTAAQATLLAQLTETALIA